MKAPTSPAPAAADASHAAQNLDLPLGAELQNPEHGLPESFGTGFAGRALFWIAVAFSTFQIITAFGIPLDKPLLGPVTALHFIGSAFIIWALWLIVNGVRGHYSRESLLAFGALMLAYLLVARYAGSLPSQVVRTLHVGFLGLVASAMLANHRTHSAFAKALWWGIGGVSLAISLYHWAFYEALIARAGEMTPADLVVGSISLALLFTLVWRVLGPALPIVAGIFLSYCLFGHLLPAPLNHRGYGFEQVIDHMAFGTEGIYSTPILVSATYIFLFILFGAFLERAGMIGLFTDIAMGLFGAARGGPAKVAVFSSALMGTISGSGVANVVSTGQFTIPLMKRFGYRAAFAGGVEATASMGGQIMPPVMGAVAFIMAETIDVPYVKIVQAAIIPALLYYVSAFVAVHLEAGRAGLVGLPRAELPSARKAFADKWHLVLPLAVLVYLLFAGYTPLFAGSVGLALTVLLVIASALAIGLGTPGARVLFWVGLGLLAAGSLAVSVVSVLSLVLVVIVVALFKDGPRATLRDCLAALADGARQALPVGLACAVVGLVIGTMTLTGIGTIFGNWVVAIGRDSLVASLFLTMIVSLILGMGIPTIPNYIITSSIAAPALLDLGVPLIISHMFVFYFGIMADLTPPVALAAFAAAPIAKESGFKIGFAALKIALPGFVIPFMAVYDPALMLQPVKGVEGTAYLFAVGYVVLKALLAIMLWGVAAVGYGLARTTLAERGLAALAALMLVVAIPWTDGVGFALALAFAAMHFLRLRAGYAPPR